MTKPKAISIAVTVWLASVAAGLAQSGPRPFSVGGGEGGGGAEGGVTGWLLAEQSHLTHLIAAKVHALHGNPGAAWGLVALGLAYGVFHAAGPGHGKAVIASYMLANERSLKLGGLLALLAALLQAAVAIALVGAAGFIFNATASEMNRTANWLELLSYGGVAAIGLWLVWRKGGALIAALRRHFEPSHTLVLRLSFALAPANSFASPTSKKITRKFFVSPTYAKTGGGDIFCKMSSRLTLLFSLAVLTTKLSTIVG